MIPASLKHSTIDFGYIEGVLKNAVSTFIAAAIAITAVQISAIPTEVSAASSTKYIVDETARPLGAISVIGDSVLLGALTYGPNLVERLAEQGWGPIRARAGMGYSTGHLAVPDWGKVSGWLAKWRAEGWDAPNVIINVGVNDAGLCAASYECSVNSINFLLDEIGDDHRVFWPNITRSAAGARDYQAVWNAALHDVARTRPQLVVWDWATLYASGNFPSGDRIHLSPSGYRERNVHIAQEATIALATTSLRGDHVQLPAPSGSPSAFLPITPQRLLDTRRSGRSTGNQGVVSVDLAEFIPDDATAVAVNLTTTHASQGGFFTAFDCATERPDVSHLNYAPRQDRGGFAIVALPESHRLCVYSYADSHVIVDLQGSFSSTASLGFSAITPERILDTRQTGRAEIGSALKVHVSSDAVATSVILTVVGAEKSGFLTAYPCSEAIPDVSNVNYLVSEPVAGSAFVPLSDGDLCIVTSSSVDVIVDLNGTFYDDAALRFVSSYPRRLLDTRTGIGGWSPIHSANFRIEVPAAPPNAEAVTGTFTIVEPLRESFLIAEPCDAITDTSVVNSTAGGVLANTATIPVSNGSVCITAYQPTHSLFDVSGWWVPSQDS